MQPHSIGLDIESLKISMSLLNIVYIWFYINTNWNTTNIHANQFKILHVTCECFVRLAIQNKNS